MNTSPSNILQKMSGHKDVCTKMVSVMVKVCLASMGLKGFPAFI